MKEVWLTTSFLGTVEYFNVLTSADVAYLEIFENYEKQSWRNRFRILSANGPIDLSIPVVKGNSLKMPVSEVRIDYRENWQKIHFRSVESAYRRSPYYEFLIDNFRFLWEVRPELLLDYNRMAMDEVLRLLKAKVVVKYTDQYRVPGYYGSDDYRYRIHPKGKKQGTGFVPVPYHQVFSDRFGFVQNLSILDWLFNDFKI